MKNAKNIAFAILWIIMLGGSIFIVNKVLAHTELNEEILTNDEDIDED